MNVGNGRSFQWQIPQTTSAQSLVDNVSQQSADQLPKFQVNPVEFDRIKMQSCEEEHP
jgi:hypothetical protein